MNIIKKLTISFLFVFILTCNGLKGQNYYYNDEFLETDLITEIGVTLGWMHALTDIGGGKGIGKNGIKDLNYRYSNFSPGFYGGVVYKNILGLRFEYNRGTIEGADSILKGNTDASKFRFTRNLSFKTPITEVAINAEIHPLVLIYAAIGDMEAPRISPYVTFGVGQMSFNPQANLNGRWVDLQPLRTEGQGFKEYSYRQPYKLSSTITTIGAGIKYELNPYINLRLELQKRFTKTDYLDDVSKDYIDPSLFANYLSTVNTNRALQLYSRINERPSPIYNADIGSQRGDQKDNDSYFTSTLKVGLLLGRLRSTNNSRFKRNTACYCSF